jgi:hypothetical protein
MFASSDGMRYTVLENLGLQRVMRVIRGNPEITRWSVSGLVTEFEGANYLLVSRAIRKK